MKKTGILLPVSSLPSDTGVGELGRYAYGWLDILAGSGITIWQILPLNPTGYGNSPYQPYSSYAGDDIYISLEQLSTEGLLTAEIPSYMSGADRVDYQKVREFKEPYLRQAFDNFTKSGEASSEAFRLFSEQKWVRQYAVFRAFKKENEGRCWNEWPKSQMEWPEEEAMELDIYGDEIRYQVFLQYIFLRQWEKLKEYAASHGISIMGDVPFYVGIDSVDVWAGKENFLLGADGRPTFIAGVPPDYFSATGQRWGNPIYDWEYMKKTDYKFWVERIGYNQKLFDIIRIDHFRAFDTFWKIPASCPTAMEGEWIEAPGYEVLDTLNARIPGMNLVAEDLGMLRKEVHVLKEHYNLKGMKILQFTLGTAGKYASDDLTDNSNMIIYTGTHDNSTIKEWYRGQTPAARRKIRRWLKRQGEKTGSAEERLIKYTLKSTAEYAVIPAADICEMGRTARLNTPGTVGSPNWEWKMTGFEAVKKGLKKYEMIIGSRR